MLLNDFHLSADDLSDEAKQRFSFYIDIQNSLDFFGHTVLKNESLTAGGRHILCSRIVQSYRTVKNILNYLATVPSQSKEEVNYVPMVVICGLPRTGTTLLYNLMACDPACRAPLLSDMSVSPIPPIPRSDIEEHKRRMTNEGILMMQVFQTAGCDFQQYSKVLSSVHPLLPLEEDATLLGCGDVKIVLCNLVPKQENLVTHYTDKQNNNYIYDYHKTVLQMLHDVDPPRIHWLLKSPVHTFWLNNLMKYYPQASLIMSHRRLNEVLPSSCRIALALSNVHFKEDDLDSMKTVIEQTSAIIDIWIERIIEFRLQQPPPENVFDIQYEDLLKDPIGTVRRIYDRFDFLQWSDEFEKSMHTWLVNNPQQKQVQTFWHWAEADSGAPIPRAASNDGVMEIRLATSRTAIGPFTFPTRDPFIPRGIGAIDSSCKLLNATGSDRDAGESTYIKLVSQNIRPTIDFVQRIHGSGYPYISNSSVYFDPFKFDKQRTCAQLEADRMDNVAALSERECVLTTSDMTDNGKKNECDFVLWKTSIPRMWP
ncbi:unnamed protein product [Rotaria sp. Silwood1]|nr:unnamed protein product [Rotaria sp. Silwood1]